MRLAMVFLFWFVGGALAQSVASEPITRTEQAALRNSIAKCWNVGALNSEALQVTVFVQVNLTADAKPEIGSIRLVQAVQRDGRQAEQMAAQDAFTAARRAIVRCGSVGFDLPADKFEQWQELNIMFDAKDMEIR